jgi:hypothetical protein
MVKVGTLLKREFGPICFLEIKQIFESIRIENEITVGSTKFVYYDYLVRDFFKNMPIN